jgi:glycosyltransferase involved in cell wall biosynthesis
VTDLHSAGVSVVLPVYNSGELLERTIASVLAQQGVELELIIVDDGSAAKTSSLLDRFADDERITLLRQANHGITAALIVGCEKASMPYIARLDVGDSMMPRRLELQAAALSENPNIGLVASQVQMMTAEGDPLFKISDTTADLEAGLRTTVATELIAPFHASVMFRRSLYNCVGGYRKQFYFAQDLDLWTRMAEKANVRVLDSVLTHGIFSASGISAQYASHQLHMKSLIAKLNARRRAGSPETQLLLQASQFRANHDELNTDKRDMFPGYYFIGKCLLRNNASRSAVYMRKAISARPWSIKAWLAFLCAKLK